MLKKIPILLCAFLLLGGVVAEARRGEGGALSLKLTDERKVITRGIGDGLLLRVVKESSVSQRDFGWRVEVVRGPYRDASRNLLYHSRRTLGAHPSQVYAWHVTSGEFPNVRKLDVQGYPVAVRVELIEPVAEGSGPDSKFVSGELRITWSRKRNNSRRADWAG